MTEGVVDALEVIEIRQQYAAAYRPAPVYGQNALVEIAAIRQTRERVMLAAKAQLLVHLAHPGECPYERGTDECDEQGAGENQLLAQPLATHFGDLERIVPPQQLEFAGLALVVELRGELEKRALPRVRHEFFADRVVAVIHLDRHHQVARMFQRIRVFTQQLLGVQQVAAGERFGDRPFSKLLPLLDAAEPDVCQTLIEQRDLLVVVLIGAQHDGQRFFGILERFGKVA